MKAKQKALQYMDSLNRKVRDTDWYKAIDIAIKEAKKEVFDDIENLVPTEWTTGYDNYNKLKQRHLSTSKNKEDDVK